MKQPNFTTEEERRAYSAGYKYGFREGMRKVEMFIQLLLCNTDDITENILQNSKEAVELRKLMTESEDKN